MINKLTIEGRIIYTPEYLNDEIHFLLECNGITHNVRIKDPELITKIMPFIKENDVITLEGELGKSSIVIVTGFY